MAKKKKGRKVDNNRIRPILNDLIGTEKPEISVKQLSKKIIKIVGRPLKIKEMPETPGSPNRRAPQMSNCESLTNYKSKISLDYGIRKTYEWYKPQFKN